MPREFLESLLAARGRERPRLLSRYREHLSQAFARYFMRVGLPVPVDVAWLLNAPSRAQRAVGWRGGETSLQKGPDRARRRASMLRVCLGTLSARDRPSWGASSRSGTSLWRRQSQAATARAMWGSPRWPVPIGPSHRVPTPPSRWLRHRVRRAVAPRAREDRRAQARPLREAVPGTGTATPDGRPCGPAACVYNFKRF